MFSHANASVTVPAGAARSTIAKTVAYRSRRDLLVSELARHLPAWRPRGAAAGLHLLVDLPGDCDERALLATAGARGVGMEGLAQHAVRPGGPGVILGYGRIAEPAIERGVRALADAARAATR